MQARQAGWEGDTRMSSTKGATRIQKRNRATILDAALDVFSTHGFRGATLDQIAEKAGLSKPNLLYYFPSKEAMHVELLSHLMEDWLEPLATLDQSGDPVEEILDYVMRKLDMARDLPRESRLFANEIVQGAPRIKQMITADLKELVDEKAKVIRAWSAAGKLADADPYHLIFSIWATTQHYADFDVQVRGILRPSGDEHIDSARTFLDQMYRATLKPKG